MLASRFVEGPRFAPYLATHGRPLPGAPRRDGGARCDEHLPPDAAFSPPAGGLFVWVTVPGLSAGGAASPGAAGGRRVRPGHGGLLRRPRRRVDAAQLLGGDQRADRGGRPEAGQGGRRAADARAVAAVAGPLMADVCVLTGGRSLERTVSLRSAARVERALRELGHAPDVIDIGPDLVGRLRDRGYDAAFICAHGRGGEDGTLQELCELLGLPYTGSGRLGQRALLRQAAAQARAGRRRPADAAGSSASRRRRSTSWARPRRCPPPSTGWGCR